MFRNKYIYVLNCQDYFLFQTDNFFNIFFSFIAPFFFMSVLVVCKLFLKITPPQQSPVPRLNVQQMPMRRYNSNSMTEGELSNYRFSIAPSSSQVTVGPSAVQNLPFSPAHQFSPAFYAQQQYQQQQMESCQQQQQSSPFRNSQPAMMENLGGPFYFGAGQFGAGGYQQQPQPNLVSAQMQHQVAMLKFGIYLNFAQFLHYISMRQ